MVNKRVYVITLAACIIAYFALITQLEHWPPKWLSNSISLMTQSNSNTSQIWNHTKEVNTTKTINSIQGNPRKIPRKYLSILRQGRLGNEMWEYSVLLGLANLTDRVPLLDPGFRDLHDVFELSLPIVSNVSRLRHTATVTDQRVHNVKETTRQLNHVQQDVRLEGYFQYFRFFQHISKDIRQEFTFRKAISRKAGNFFRTYNLSDSSIVKVGIHVRHNQLGSPGWIKMGFGPPELAYYVHAMKYFRKKYKNVVFVLCSDNVGWARTHVVGDNIVYVPSHAAGVDMAILASCDHVIISNGTYSWWAGWLCKGITVRYSKIPINGTDLYVRTAGDHWPPDDEYNHYIAINS
jgi:galactoside 2-L-fucosyltransferase 1/2